jgi:hypothetical protein
MQGVEEEMVVVAVMGDMEATAKTAAEVVGEDLAVIVKKMRTMVLRALAAKVAEAATVAMAGTGGMRAMEGT